MAEKNREEKKYYSKLGIVPISIDNVKRIIKTNIKNTIDCWNKGINIEKQTFHVIGEAGTGKTQISLQLAKELSEELKIKFDSVLIKAPVLSRDDFLCPFPVIDNGNSKFKMLYSNFVPMEPDTYGLFIIDEFARGDHSLQQLLWQVQNEYKLHLQDLPKGWFVLCLDNPDDQEYSMNYMEDAAGLRRTLHLYSDVSAEAFLNHAVKSNFHPDVIEFIQIHPDYLYDFGSQKIGMIYANPASWERVSNILWGYGNEILNHTDDLITLFSGLLNSSMTRMFISFIKDRTDISPRDVFYKYDNVRKEILKYTKESNNIKLGQLMDSFISFLTSSKPKCTDNEYENISKFLVDIPSDISVMILTKMSGSNRSSEEFKYMANLHTVLNAKYEDYRIKFYEAMVNGSKKATGDKK